ncbi:MAG: hypothetical protein ACXVHL_32125, partial [Solirubrobacteraceae bacterium]
FVSSQLLRACAVLGVRLVHASPRAATTKDGLTRSQISQTLNHNQPAGQIDHALHALHTAGRVTATQIPTGGRPAQLWNATLPGA